MGSGYKPEPAKENFCFFKTPRQVSDLREEVTRESARSKNPHAESSVGRQRLSRKLNCPEYGGFRFVT